VCPACSQVASIGGVDLQIIRDWMDGTLQSVWPNGLRDRKAPGKTRYLTDAQREAVEACQQPYMDSVAR